MRSLRLAVLATSIAAICGLRPAVGDTSEAQPWAVLFYLSGDSNLEADFVARMADWAAAGAPPGVLVAALFDRSRDDDEKGGYSGADVGKIPAWSGGRLLRLDGHEWKDLDPQRAGTPTDMGDPNTLTAFVDRLTSASTRRVAVVLSGHGSRFAGLFDETADPRTLTPREAGEALRCARAGCAIDLVVLDYCNAASYEVARAFVGATRVLGAPVTECFSDSIRYEALFGLLRREPFATPRSVAGCLAESFECVGPATSDRQSVGCLSMLDLDALPELDATLQTLAMRLHEGFRRSAGPTFRSFARARLAGRPLESVGGCFAPPTGAPRCRALGLVWRSESPAPVVQLDSSCMSFDLAHLADGLPVATDARLRIASRRAAEAARRVAFATSRGRDLADAGGVPLYVPCDPDLGLDATAESLGDAATGSPWSEGLTELLGYGCCDGAGVALESVRVAVVDAPGGKELRVESRIASPLEWAGPSAFVVSVGARRTVLALVPVDPGCDGSLVYSWDGSWFTLKGDGDQEIPLAMTWSRRLPGCAPRYAGLTAFTRDGQDETATLLFERCGGTWSATIHPGYGLRTESTRIRRLHAGVRVRAAPQLELAPSAGVAAAKPGARASLPDAMSATVTIGRDGPRVQAASLRDSFPTVAAELHVGFVTRTLGDRYVYAEASELPATPMR